MARTTPRNSLKKHDAATSSRASKARRERATTQVRKDKRRETVQAKRRRLLSSDDVALSGRDIGELVGILAGTHAGGGSGGGGGGASHAEQYEVLKEIRALLAANEHDYEAVERVIESGIVPVLVALLESASPLSSATRSGGDVYKEVLWCLTNIASGQYEHTKLVLPAVPRLLQFLEGANDKLAEHAAWVLGNIAADCDEFRQQLIANGAVGPLTKQLAAAARRRDQQALAKTCAWALSNMARGHETSAKPFVDAGLVPVLVAGLTPPDQQQAAADGAFAFDDALLVEVAWLLSCLTAREDEYLQLWLEQGLAEKLLPYFAASTDELLLTPVLRVLGNACCGAADHHTDAWQLPYVERLLQHGDAAFLRKLHAFLEEDASHTHLAAEAAWVLSNLATLDARVVDLLVQFQFPALLARHFRAGSFEVRREAAFALTNVALTSATHLERVLQLDVLDGYLRLLSAADVAVVGNSLRMVENVLRVAPQGVARVEAHGGIEAIENVQYQSEEPHLAKWAEALVNEFYGENYGINSPPSLGAVGGAVPTFNFELPPPAAPAATTASGVAETPAGGGPGGRGRGAHMTVPAWKK